MINMKKAFSIILPVSLLSLSFVSAKDFNKTKEPIKSEKSIVTVSSTSPEMNEEGLVNNSNVVVKGKVVGMSKPFEVIPADGSSSSIFTDYYIEPTEFIAGSELISNKLKLSIRVEGGDLKNTTVINESNPNLTIGHTYTLFLAKPDIGGSYNTKGEYFYITGAEQGVMKDESSSTLVSNNRSKNLKINKNNLKNKKNFIKNNSMKKTFTAGLKQNLKSGFISQDEYNQAIASFNDYATVNK